MCDSIVWHGGTFRSGPRFFCPGRNRSVATEKRFVGQRGPCCFQRGKQPDGQLLRHLHLVQPTLDHCLRRQFRMGLVVGATGLPAHFPLPRAERPGLLPQRPEPRSGQTQQHVVLGSDGRPGEDKDSEVTICQDDRAVRQSSQQSPGQRRFAPHGQTALQLVADDQVQDGPMRLTMLVARGWEGDAQGQGGSQSNRGAIEDIGTAALPGAALRDVASGRRLRRLLRSLSGSRCPRQCSIPTGGSYCRPATTAGPGCGMSSPTAHSRATRRGPLEKVRLWASAHTGMRLDVRQEEG